MPRDAVIDAISNSEVSAADQFKAAFSNPKFIGPLVAGVALGLLSGGAGLILAEPAEFSALAVAAASVVQTGAMVLLAAGAVAQVGLATEAVVQSGGSVMSVIGLVDAVGMAGMGIEGAAGVLGSLSTASAAAETVGIAAETAGVSAESAAQAAQIAAEEANEAAASAVDNSVGNITPDIALQTTPGSEVVPPIAAYKPPTTLGTSDAAAAQTMADNAKLAGVTDTQISDANGIANNDALNAAEAAKAQVPTDGSAVAQGSTLSEM